MKSDKIYRAVLVFTLAILTTTGYAQTMTQGEPTMEIREQADEEAEMWTDELALTAKQEDLMEKKIIEFAMKRMELLQSKM